MTTEQGGAPSASAGGAPAPTFDHESAQENVRRLAQLFGMSVADVAGPPFRPNCRCQVTPLPPFKRRPVLGDPSLNMTGDEDGNTWPEGVGWALSWGCQLTFGRDEKTAVPYVQVSLSDEDRRRGITQRTATRAQVAKFARMLAEQFGEPAVPDPRDAEIEQLRTALARYQKRLGDDLLCGGKLVERVRAALRVDNGSTCIRASMDGVAGDVGRLCDEIERLRNTMQEIADLVAADATRPDSVCSAVENWLFELDQRRGERDEARMEWKRADAEVTRLKRRLRQDLDQHLADENSAQAANDRMRQELDLQHADRLRWLCEALNVNPANETWLTAMRRVRHLRQNFSDSPRCEVSESDGWRCRLFAGHDGKHLAQKPTGERREWPFDNKRTPRYWHVGDPEPEIGTTVWRGPDKYTRSSNGWHHIDIHTGYASWAWILSIGSEVVEAVDRG